MVEANGSALPNYEHEQPQRLNDHHSLNTDPENDPIPHSQKTITSSPRRARSALPSRGPKPLLPRSLKEALQLASLLSKSKLVPKGFENQEACLVGILYGMEVGLSPIAALQRMAIIDGRPTIWGDAALALVEASGLLLSISEDVIESEIHKNSTPHFSAICTVKREGRSDPVIRSFSIEDAKRAGLWQKPGPWKDYPKRMLMMRARAFALRDAFPDVLTGLYLREELEGVEAETRYAKPELGSGSDSIDSETKLDREEKSYLRSNSQQDILETETFRRPSQSNSRSSIRRAPPPPREVDLQATSKTEKQPSTSSQYLDKNEDLPDLTESDKATDYQTASDTLELFDSALACANDEETLEEIREEFTERIDRLDNAVLQHAGRLFLRHEKRIRATEDTFKIKAQSFEPTTTQKRSAEISGEISTEGNLARSEEGLVESDDELTKSESGKIWSDEIRIKRKDELEANQYSSPENAIGRIGKESLSPHRRRRFSIRPRKGLSLAELNARRKVDLLKYLPPFSTNEEDSDED